ncbi:AER228Cp [Eremothecium gossypii ATCC 10895]|uniref:Phosphoglycerate mutase n=1 Tax=Eremothecium gossypii (strain ATCC 10895 / CBS 109.51 / FGSC 9923 / NRRL Y-1056) TaxID=284811 RepID=Q756M6_EREGS|nr:AER228Cp [Eremothecium gossypii ATCC 10895]AAS52909.1 AER228Cp [Eremothecium gossypii ATCC 10895]AEY97217.1 FAER228Cp [Eremothecium gossypii FDAG1]
MTENRKTVKLFLLRHGESELNHAKIFCGWIDAHLTDKGKDQARSSASLIASFCREHGIEPPLVGYTSRLLRTIETMQVIMKELRRAAVFQTVVDTADALAVVDKVTAAGQTPVLQVWTLNERHYGSWQGQRKSSVLEQFGKSDYMLIRRDYNGRPPAVDLGREMIQEDNEQGPLTGYDFKEPNRRLKYGPELEKAIELPRNESLADVIKRLAPFLNEVVLKLLHELGESAIIVAHGSTVRSVLKILANISEEDIKDIDIPTGNPLVIELNASDMSFVRHFYLDPESARKEAENVRNEGCN